MTSRPARHRYCRCGTHLAADNPGLQCARCERASRDKLIAPPEVPAEFWQTEQFTAAFAAQHMGWVARTYRTHPYHHAVYGPSGIPRLFGDDDGTESGTVFTAAAALTEMAGWMAHDAGCGQAAKQHFGRSLALVQIGGDHQLGAHVLGSMSHLANHLSQPDEAIALARQGQAVLQNAAPHPDLEARLLAMEARGFAGRQESRECVKLLIRAEEALDKSPTEPSSPWISRFDMGFFSPTAPTASLVSS
ncbi:MAG: hypothetical protein JO115_01010 [Pseudonocardiales bacterium]|nr:hypothetical protein [Pseudonocardiales bacterium]